MVKKHGCLTARANAPLRGVVSLAGDKSLSHRAFMMAAMAVGESVIHNALLSDDIRATLRCLSCLGVRIDRDGETHRVGGRGGVGLVTPSQPLDCGNSGTAARLLCGLLAGHDVWAQMTGDASLSERPMARVIAPLRAMGAHIECRDDHRLPLTIRGMSPLLPIDWRSPVASAQVKSSILFAALNALGDTTFIEPSMSRDHSERMMTLYGAHLQQNIHKDGYHITMKGLQTLIAPSEPLVIPSDPSSAALMATAAAMTKGSLSFPHLLINAHRIGFFEMIEKMGAEVRYDNSTHACGEDVADVHVSFSQPLQSVTIDATRSAVLIDEYPALAVLAAVAHGTSRFCGLAELRHKESNRLEGLCDKLARCGVSAVVEKDDLIIDGSNGEMIQGGQTIDGDGDHRIAMSFILLSLHSRDPIGVTGTDTIATSFPKFITQLRQCGAQIESS